jgi:ABC-type transport system involved in multi-copper enzyme maturation permease subunit
MIALRLLAIEWLKARRRPVFWMTTGAFLVIFSLGLGINQYHHALDPENNRAFSLPSRWQMLIGGTSDLAWVLVVVALALLIASERTWRTDRQNVIDGLSRAQFFTGKILLALAVVLTFWLMTIAIGMFFALIDGAAGYTDGTGPLFPATIRYVLGGYLVHLTAVAGMGLMFGVIASSSGAALALTFVFMIAQTPILMYFANEGGIWMEIARRAPVFVLNQLTNPAIYDAARLAEFNTRMQGSPLPLLLPGIEANLFALGYAVLFAAIGWFSFRRRDL